MIEVVFEGDLLTYHGKTYRAEGATEDGHLILSTLRESKESLAIERILGSVIRANADLLQRGQGTRLFPPIQERPMKGMRFPPIGR